MPTSITSVRSGITVVETRTVEKATGAAGMINSVKFRMSFSSGGQTITQRVSHALKTPISATNVTEETIIAAVLSAPEFGTAELEGLRTASAKMLVDKIADANNTVVYYSE